MSGVKKFNEIESKARSDDREYDMYGEHVLNERRREILNKVVVFTPNENFCLLAALWGVANEEQKKLMTNGGETNVKDMFMHSMGKGKDDVLRNGARTDGDFAIMIILLMLYQRG